MTQALSNEELVRRYAAASARYDLDALASMRHPAWTVDWPQSGERVRGSQAFAAISANYPGGQPIVEIDRIVGSEDHWVTSPLGGAYKVGGDGESWWAELRMIYPDGRTWFTITLIEVRDGKVWRETQYWAEPFDAPEWRREFVDRLGTA